MRFEWQNKKVNRFKGKRIQEMLYVNGADGIFEEKRIEKFKNQKQNMKWHMGMMETRMICKD